MPAQVAASATERPSSATRRSSLALLVLVCLALLLLDPGGVAAAPDSSTPAARAPVAPLPNSPKDAANTRSGKVIVILVDGIGLDDLDVRRQRGLREMIAEGAVGLMNSRTEGVGSGAGYLTLGAGERGLALPPAPLLVGSGFALNSTDTSFGIEPVSVYQARTGVRAPPEGVVHMFGYELARLNAKNERGAIPGLLGETLARSGLRVGVAGNADGLEALNRAAVLVAMDEKGTVPFGDVGRNMRRANPASVGQRETDYARLERVVRSLLKRVDVVVVETGDTARINAEVLSMNSEVVAAKRAAAIGRADSFLSRLKRSLDPTRDNIILVAPSPANDADETSKLVPIILWGKSIQPGLATSASTRRAGIVTNMDIAPTILTLAGAGVPIRMAGRPIGSTPSMDPLRYLNQRQSKIYAVEAARKPLLTAFVAMVVGVTIAALAFVLLRLGGTPVVAVRIALLFVLSMPVSMLLVAALKPLTPLPMFVTTSVIAMVVALAAEVLGNNRFASRGPLISVVIVSLFTAAMVLLDLMMGSRLGADSVLGYSVIGGSRFYGIGNEYMGSFLGATIVGLGALLDNAVNFDRARLAVIVTMALALLVIAMPFWGANLGGTIAVSAGFATLAIRLIRGKFSFAEAAILFVVVTVAVGVFLGVDLVSESQSHAAKAATGFAQDSGQGIAKVAERKIAMNYRLLKVSIWSQILLAGIAVIAVLLYRPTGLLVRMREGNPRFSSAMVALLVGATFALLFNDSGVVAAAAASLYGIGALLYLLLEPLARPSVDARSA